MNNYIYKKAFTIAEVLITLGVIGIIAAMTLPNLMGAYRKKVIETELQRAFSIISETIKMSEAFNGSAAYWSYPQTGAGSSVEGRLENEKFIDLYIKPYIKYIRTDNENYKVYYTDHTQSYLTNYINKAPQFILADGIFLQFMPVVNAQDYIMTVYVGTTNHNQKKEFIEGRNLFAFTVNIGESSSKVGVSPHAFRNWSCQKLEAERMTFLENCYKNQRESSGLPSSLYCTYIIYCNNWKIPDDYPVKL